MKNPAWWNEKHDSAWDRVKSAMKRDWEQTKNDFSSKSGRDLDQDVGDTVKQAAGKEPIPPMNQPNPSKMDKAWDDIEPSVRYGVGAREQYNQDWDPELERRMQSDWAEVSPDRPWDDVKGSVQRAYTSAKKG